MPSASRLALLLLATSASLPLAGRTSAAQAPAPAARVVMLGTGTPILSAAHSGQSVGILVNRALYVFDAGSGVERRMLEGAAKGITFDTLPALFITHLHSDHTLGVPSLIYNHGKNAAFGSGGPLAIFGPPGTTAMVNHILAAWSEDREVRNANNDETHPSWFAHARDITEPGVVYRDSNVTVKAFIVPHTRWPRAYGYRIETRDRVIVLSGDTQPSDAIVAACNGCDVLVHEVYSAEGFAKIPKQRQQYHSHSHTSTYELAELATRARPKLLVLNHQLYFGGTSDEDLVREVRSRYKGAVAAAKDLDTY